MTTSNEPTEDPVEVLSNIIKLLKEKKLFIARHQVL